MLLHFIARALIHIILFQENKSFHVQEEVTSMDQPTSSLDSNSATTGSTYASNKRKFNNNMGGERTVVAVKIEGNGKKQRSEGSPSDCWSWRKYGQKPIKGSPYPRGYYRCSTSKNCSAKKQVERCKKDATTLIITYTCAHNHPEPDSQKQEPEGTSKQEQEPESKHEQETHVKDHNNNIDQGDHFQCPKFTFSSLEDHLVEENPFSETTSVLIYNEDLQRSSLPLDFSEVKTEENDFYDELEELPTSSFFTAFMRSDFCDLLNPC